MRRQATPSVLFHGSAAAMALEQLKAILVPTHEDPALRQHVLAAATADDVAQLALVDQGLPIACSPGWWGWASGSGGTVLSPSSLRSRLKPPASGSALIPSTSRR